MKLQLASSLCTNSNMRWVWHQGTDQELQKPFTMTMNNSVIQYPVVICGLGVLVTGDDLRSHPIGCTDEGVPSTDRLVKLGRYAKIH